MKETFVDKGGEKGNLNEIYASVINNGLMVIPSRLTWSSEHGQSK